MSKEIDIFIVKNENSIKDFNLDRLVSIGGELIGKSVYEPCGDTLRKQLSKLEIEGNIEEVDIEEIPASTSSRLVGIFDENCLIPHNYLLSAISLYNMYNSYAAFCGPISTHSSSKPTDWFISEIAKHYKSYSLNEFSNVLAFDITKEPDNFSPTLGSIFSGRFYNELGGYSPVLSPRGYIKHENSFMGRMASEGSILYSKSINTAYYITPNEFNVQNFSRYFYEKGYCKGLQLQREMESKYETLWKMFVESPESIDNRTLSFTFIREEIDDDKKKKYAEKLAIIKCMYQIGMFEGINGQKIL